MMAKGANSVVAQDNPAKATMAVAPAWLLTRKVASIRILKKAWEQLHAWMIRGVILAGFVV